MRKNQRERDDEASSSEEDGEEEERVSNAQRGRVRLHGAVQSFALYQDFFFPLRIFS